MRSRRHQEQPFVGHCKDLRFDFKCCGSIGSFKVEERGSNLTALLAVMWKLALVGARVDAGAELGEHLSHAPVKIQGDTPHHGDQFLPA
jgi:hypothetical protein